MNIFYAVILGIIQGLTEFLPVSSSGHIEVATAIIELLAPQQINPLLESVTFSLFVHFATALSVIYVYRKDILELCIGVIQKEFNEEKKYVLKLVISSIPVLIVYIIFSEQLNSLFTGNLLVVGSSFFVTTLLLASTYLKIIPNNSVTNKNSFIIGIAQAFAILPGISRAGSTIITGLQLGIKQKEVAKFSFLMSLIPILGSSLLEFLTIAQSGGFSSARFFDVFIGSIAALLTGIFALKFLLSTIKQNRLYYFAPYTFVLAIVCFVLLAFT